jgi:hypothetical protein
MAHRETYIQSDGSKCDLSTGAVIRPNFMRHCREIRTTAELRATLRAGRTTDLGGYPLYFITSDGAALSFESVRKELRSVLWAIASCYNTGGWRVIGCDVNYEDGELTCDHSGARIPSAYGED